MVIATGATPHVSSTVPRQSENALPEGGLPASAFLGYVSEVLALPGVRKAHWVTANGLADLFVLIDVEDSDEAEQVHALKREYRRRLGTFPMTVRVVSLKHVEERNLPPASWVFTKHLSSRSSASSSP